MKIDNDFDSVWVSISGSVWDSVKDSIERNITGR